MMRKEFPSIARIAFRVKLFKRFENAPSNDLHNNNKINPLNK